MHVKRKKTAGLYAHAFALTFITVLLTLCHGEVQPPVASAVFGMPPNSPLVDFVPTDIPDFHSTHYYLDSDDDDEWASRTTSSSSSFSSRKSGESTDAPRRRSANPPEVRCALNRTSASLCKASGTPIGCACDKLCHGKTTTRHCLV